MRNPDATLLESFSPKCQRKFVTKVLPILVVLKFHQIWQDCHHGRCAYLNLGKRSCEGKLGYPFKGKITLCRELCTLLGIELVLVGKGVLHSWRGGGKGGRIWSRIGGGGKVVKGGMVGEEATHPPYPPIAI